MIIFLILIVFVSAQNQQIQTTLNEGVLFPITSRLTSCFGEYFVHQPDGNIVLYDSNNVSLWSSNTTVEHSDLETQRMIAKQRTLKLQVVCVFFFCFGNKFINF